MGFFGPQAAEAYKILEEHISGVLDDQYSKRQRKVFQDFRREKDELQKRYDKQHSELLEAKSRQATLKLRVGALQTAEATIRQLRSQVAQLQQLNTELYEMAADATLGPAALLPTPLS